MTQSAEMNKLNQILLYVLGSIAFLLIPILSPPPGTVDVWNVFSNPGQLKDIFGYVLTLLFFYGCYFYFIPKLLFQRKYVLFISACVVSFCLITAIPNVLPIAKQEGPQHTAQMNRPHFSDDGHRPPPKPRNDGMLQNVSFHVLHNFLRFAVVLSLAMSLKIYSRWKQTQKEKAEAELAFLKAQVNPHFLFNTLNSIYSLALTKSDKTADAVVKLSSLMRYSISDSTLDKVSISKELAYINNYISLQQLRLTDNVLLNYHVNTNHTDKSIAPFMLIPFIENAFKYGVHTEEDSQIDIDIQVSETMVRLSVRNKKENIKLDTESQTGLGIANTKDRLELIYPAKYMLDIKDENNYFDIKLELYW